MKMTPMEWKKFVADFMAIEDALEKKIAEENEISDFFDELSGSGTTFDKIHRDIKAAHQALWGDDSLRIEDSHEHREIVRKENTLLREIIDGEKFALSSRGLPTLMESAA